MNVLLLGARGMLGTDMTRTLERMENIRLTTADIAELDICDLSAVDKYIGSLRDDVDISKKSAERFIVINCAAFTNVDACETETRQAYAANALGPRNLAIACNKHGAALAHISTDYVFDGDAGRDYLEDDPVNPINVYGKSKLAGENNVRALTNKHYIIRTQWIYGINGKNFVETMLNAAASGRKLKIVSDQFGSPTTTKDLAAAIAELICTEAYGTYHITNSGVVSWYRFALDIFEAANIRPDVEPCATIDYPTKARRPKFTALKNFNWELSGFKPLRDYKDALRDYITEREQQLKKQ